MAHAGIMGITPLGFAYLSGFTAFFYFLSRSFTGPDEPKFVLSDSKLVEIAKQAQPALHPEHYILKKKPESS